MRGGQMIKAGALDQLKCPHCSTILMIVQKDDKSYLTYESLTHFIACSDTARAEKFRDLVKAGEYAKDGTPLDEPETP
jgi:hypothetical protein